MNSNNVISNGEQAKACTIQESSAAAPWDVHASAIHVAKSPLHLVDLVGLAKSGNLVVAMSFASLGG